MFKRWMIFWALAGLLLGSVAVQAENKVETAKTQLQEALLKKSFYGEYTESVFRFGRRSDRLYRIWSSKDGVAWQVINPAWQQGEVSLLTRNTYKYYIPALQTGLRVSPAKMPPRTPWWDWEPYIKRLEVYEGLAAFNGREMEVYSGHTPHRTFRIWVDPQSHFPWALEVFSKQIKQKEASFIQVEALAPGFKFQTLIPENIKWVEDEAQFWQNVSVPRVGKAVNFNVLRPAYLPEGYRFKKADVRELPSATVVHLIYQGPHHNLISLFEREKLSEKQTIELKSFKKHGKVFEVRQWFQDGVHLALIGSVSREELEKIKASIK